MSAASPDRARTYNNDLADLVERVPGFGGMFFDSTEQFVVYLKDESRIDDARAGLREFFLRQAAGNGILASERLEQVNRMKVL